MFNYGSVFLTVAAMLSTMTAAGMASAQDSPDCSSGVRDPRVSVRAYREACLSGAPQSAAPVGEKLDFSAMSISALTVEEAGEQLNELRLLDLEALGVPVWTNLEISTVFKSTRDQRYLDDIFYDDYNPRSLPWQFPDTGCTARAQQVITLAGEMGFTGDRAPYKLWALDMREEEEILEEPRLVVETANAHPDEDPPGTVQWFYHVAPLVLNEYGEPIVLDPALNPCGPIFWEDWLALMVDDLDIFNDVDSELVISVSDGNAFGPQWLAFDDPNGSEAERMSLEEIFGADLLSLEWSRQILTLGRDPEARFGDFPEWIYDVYEAELMYHSTGTTYEDGWNVYDNGYISFNHSFNGGTQKMTVRASGQAADGRPNMRVTVGGTDVFNGNVSPDGWSDYTFSFAAPVGQAEVRIYFTNDYYQPPLDRNLFIDKAAVECSNAPVVPDPDSVVADFTITNDWGGGYCATVDVTNTAAVPTTNWIVVVDTFSAGIYTSWNVDPISGTGTHTLTGNANWNRVINPSQTYSGTGFCAFRAGADTTTLPSIVSATGTY